MKAIFEKRIALHLASLEKKKRKLKKLNDRFFELEKSRLQEVASPTVSFWRSLRRRFSCRLQIAFKRDHQAVSKRKSLLQKECGQLKTMIAFYRIQLDHSAF